MSLCVSTLNQVLKLLCFFAKGAFFNRLFLAISTVRLDIVSISFAFPQTALTVDCRQFQLSASSPNICLWFAKRRLDFNTLSLIHQNILNNLTSALHIYLYTDVCCSMFLKRFAKHVKWDFCISEISLLSKFANLSKNDCHFHFFNAEPDDAPMLTFAVAALRRFVLQQTDSLNVDQWAPEVRQNAQILDFFHSPQLASCSSLNAPIYHILLRSLYY